MTTLEISTLQNRVLYTKNFQSQEGLSAFLETYGQSKMGWNLFQMALCPLRTENLTDFSKDFFFPTVVHFTSTDASSNYLQGKIQDSLIFGLPLDLMTLPIRTLTAPFRIFYNLYFPEPPHPLTTLLQDESHSILKLRTIKKTLTQKTTTEQIVRLKTLLDLAPTCVETKVYRKNPAGKRWILRDCTFYAN